MRKALSKLKCEECRACLVCSESPANKDIYKFLYMKNAGGLVLPSEGVVRIVQCTERIIREKTLLSKSHGKGALIQLQSQVLGLVGPDALDMEEHARQTGVGIDNHYFDIIRLIVSIFYNVRCHHAVRLHNAILHSEKIRNKYNKLVLFKGQ